MSEIEQQLTGLEVTIQEAKDKIERSAQLRRLEQNKDFQALFLNGLMEKDAVRSVMLLAAPGLKAPGEGPAVARAGIEARINMIGELYNWCRYTHLEAEGSLKALHDHEEARQELLAEQLEE